MSGLRLSSNEDIATGQCGSRVKTVLTLILIGVAIEQPAAAYTDPGSGALILQMIAAAAVGGLFYFRKLLSFFRRSIKDPKE
jgi:hypothetical protein